MKKYSSVFELETELIAQGCIKDRDVAILPNSDPEEGCLTDSAGNTLYSYPAYKAYYIHLANQPRVGSH